MNKSIKVLIMCGGRGRRLGKLTDQIPKPLVDIGGKSILEFKMEKYLEAGFKEFVFCIGYKGDMIKKHLQRFAGQCDMIFSEAGEKAGILERLWVARDVFSENILMTYGDTYAEIDFNRFIDEHLNLKKEATIVVTPIENPFGIVEFDHQQTVTYFKEKPTQNYYIGYALIGRKSLDLIPKKVIGMPDGEGLVTFFKILIAMEKLGSFFHSGLQVTFNTIDDLQKAEESLIRFYTSPEDHEK